MVTDLKSDADVKKKAEAFFNLALRAVIRDSNKIPFLMTNGKFRLHKNISFEITKDLLRAQRELIARCTKLLGARAAHEKEIEDIAWDCLTQNLIADEHAQDSKKVFWDFIETLSQHAEMQYQFVAPNHVVSLLSSISKIQIGPVEAILTSDLRQDLFSNNEDSIWTVSAGKQFEFKIIDGKVSFQFPPVMWRVTIQAARGHLEEEATWLINIAISLLRLSYPLEKRCGLFPREGEKEPLPLYMEYPTKPGLVFSKGELVWGGETTSGKSYEIDDEIHFIVNSDEFKTATKEIFSAAKNSLAERLAQGLGWLTRGRQAADRAEKFLFFFTAIESLLSSNDKSAPVVQTIARYVAVILQEDAGLRFQIARKIMSLYELRSALVHAGKRNVSSSDVSMAQAVAENLYSVVMREMDLKIPFADFHTSLSEASYGSAWP